MAGDEPAVAPGNPAEGMAIEAPLVGGFKRCALAAPGYRIRPSRVAAKIVASRSLFNCSCPA